MNKTIEEFEKWLLAQEKPAAEGEMTLGKINEYRTHMCKHAFEGGFNAAQALMSQGEPVGEPPIAHLCMWHTEDMNGRDDGFEVCSEHTEGAFPVYTSPTEANAELVEYAKKLRDELDTIESLSYIDSVHQCAKEALAISLPTAMKGK